MAVLGPQNSGSYSAADIARRREFAKMLLADGFQAKDPLGALAKTLSGSVAGYENRQASQAEDSGREAFGSSLADMLSNPDVTLAQLAETAGNPFANSGQQALISALMGREMDESDPMRQMQLEKMGMEMDAMRNPAPTPEEFDYIETEDGSVLRVGKNGGGMDIMGAEGQFAAPPDLTSAQQNYDALVSQGVPVAEARQLAFGGNSTNVTVNNAGTDDFYKTLDEERGKQWAGLIEAGQTAMGNNQRLTQLEGLLQSAPQGAAGGFTQLAGSLGIPMEGLDEVQAAQALINQMVPGQRPPGSGTMSDADLALFKQSLPSIINQPGGNQLILATAKAINDYTLAQAAIAERVANREITPEEASELQKTIPNPLAEFKAASATGEPAKPTTDEEYNALPSGALFIDPEDGKTYRKP